MQPSTQRHHSFPTTLALAGLLLLGGAGCDLGAFDGTFADGDAGVDDVDDPTPDQPGPLPDAGFPTGCNASCHGDEENPAPPKNLTGDTSPDSPGVGAHRAHLDPTPTWHRAVSCEDCHQVPSAVGDPGHIDDGDNQAEIEFSAIAQAGGASPTFDGDRCDVYCHGTTLGGGALTQPAWTQTDGEADACGACHGAPPPAPHPPGDDCGTCHPTMQPGTLDFLDPASHINGVVDLAGDGDLACDGCHGDGGVSAPPRALDGSTARSARGVGAHRDHLVDADWHRPVQCVSCHVVPTETGSPGHLDGDDVAEITFDALNPAATFAVTAARCDNLYCHGNGRGNNGTMVWTDEVTMQCTSCHAMSAGGAAGLGGEHGEHFGEGAGNCIECHQPVVDGSRNIIAPLLHVNGQREIGFRTGGTWNPAERRCTNLACHGSERW